MSLLHARDLSLRYGKKILLDGASFTLGHHDRVGLIGPNGSGKSTLMKILAGRGQPDSGEVQLVRHARAGYLPQELSELPPGSLIEGVLSSVPGRAQLLTQLAATEKALAAAKSEEDQVELAGELSELHEELTHHEERYGRHRAEAILLGLGFALPQLERPATELSGGWRMRAALAGLLLQDPELLLLDEPTNHLDVPTLEWFDEFLQRSRRALLLVSHDRDFLDRQINRVLSLEPEGVRTYVGNYEDYLLQREQEVAILEKTAAKQEKQRAQVEEFIRRFRAKATKAKQVQSRIKLLAKQEKIERLEERATVHFRFPEAPRSGREVASLSGIGKRYGDKVIYRGLQGQVLRGERIAVIGLNGTGKTTLLKLLAGEIAPDQGTVTLGHNVILGYFAQHHTESLDPGRTILEEISRLVPTQPQSWVRSVLGSFLFSGDDVDKKIAVLSGGERARVSLAKLLVVPSNFLLMDEPTNHLDLDSSEALIEALSGYEGTLLFVSHNRSFVNGLATQVWEVKDGAIDPQPGNLDAWHERRAAAAAAQAARGPETAARESASAAEAAGKPGLGAQARRERAKERERKAQKLGPLRKAIAALEERIARLESDKQAFEASLADPAVFAEPERARALTANYRTCESELALCYAQWEAQQEELSQAEAALDESAGVE